MNLTILGATGGTGRELTRQALERGHEVTAIARHPGRLDLPAGDQPNSDRLLRVAAAMLDEAETRAHPGQTLIPVDR
jgi:hypothetical protein